MRIACLQFAPQVGDIDNNLNRADAVLSRANPEDLDVLVLPELAFTGYNFKSLQDISPFLEPSGSGISSLWARTTALKYNCVVGVGYPEKVDVAQKWPTSPEYYNSLIVVNGEGETVANYRKSFLYYTDETWALEGPDGFFEGHIPGLGHCSMGICMDLNPYKFEAPWHAFEFAFHVLEMESNLVIISMAWLTREDGRHFSRMPKEPDMETLTYWVTRMEPLIRAENDDEIIVVFCNRTGIEDDAVYAGTSAVIGIKSGEVNVYGMLGRGEKELLVVDTDNAPYAKLVYRPDSESAGGSQLGSVVERADNSVPPPPPEPDTQAESRRSDSPRSGEGSEPKVSPTAQQQGASPKSRPPVDTAMKTVVETTKPPPRKNKPQSPKLQIPYSPSLAEVAAKLQEDAASGQTPVQDGIPTPTGPSPTPQALRPRLGQPEQTGKGQPKQHVATPHPNARPSNDTRIFGGHVLISQELFTPTTPFEEATPASPRYFWMPHDSLLKSPGLRRDWTPALPDSPTLNFKSRSPAVGMHQNSNYKIAGHAMVPADNALTLSQSPPPAYHTITSGIDAHTKTQPNSGKPENQPARPSSPKSRNASRTGRPERSDSALAQRPDFADLNQRLESVSVRPGSAMAQGDNSSKNDEDQPERPSSPKSRNASRSRPWLPADELVAEQRRADLSQSALLRAASPPTADQSTASLVAGGKYSSIDNAFNPGKPGQHIRRASGSNICFERPGSRQGTPLGSRADRPQSRTAIRTQTPGISEAIGEEMNPRHASRGRQPGPDGPVQEGGRIVPPDRSQSRRGLNREDIVRGRPREKREGSLGHQNGAGFEPEIVRVSPDCPVHGGNACYHPPAQPGPDDIVEVEIIRSSPSCPVHGHRRPSAPRPGHNSPPREASSQPPPNYTAQNPRHEGSSTSPALCGSSIKSVKSSKNSPATPQFEPKTPKAMVLPHDDDDAIPTTALTAPLQKSVIAVQQDIITRPRSAVW